MTTLVSRPTAVRRRADVALLALAAAVVLGTLLAVAAAGRHPSSDITTQARDVAAGLRCPVCQDLSAADSPAPMAAQMRRQILDDLRRGRSPEHIRSTFVSAYGPSVLMTPARHGIGAVAYALPLLVLGLGAGTGGLLLRRWLRRPDDVGGHADVRADGPADVDDLQEVAR